MLSAQTETKGTENSLKGIDPIDILNQTLEKYGANVYNLYDVIDSLTLISERILKEFDKQSKNRGVYYETIDDYTKSLQSDISNLKTEINTLTQRLNQSKAEAGIVIKDTPNSAIVKIKELLEKLGESEQKISAQKIRHHLTEDKLRLVTDENKKLSLQLRQINQDSKDHSLNLVPELEKYAALINELTKKLEENKQLYNTLKTESQEKLSKEETAANNKFDLLKEKFDKSQGENIALKAEQDLLKQELLETKKALQTKPDTTDQIEKLSERLRQSQGENTALKAEQDLLKQELLETKKALQTKPDPTDQIEKLSERLRQSEGENTALKAGHDLLKQELLETKKALQTKPDTTDQIEKLTERLRQSEGENTALKAGHDLLKQELLETKKALQTKPGPTDQIEKLTERLRQSEGKNTALKAGQDILKQELLQIKEGAKIIKEMPIQANKIKELIKKIKESEQKRLILEGEVKNIISLYQELDRNKKSATQFTERLHQARQGLTVSKDIKNLIIINKNQTNLFNEFNTRLTQSIEKRIILEGEVKNIISIYETLIENRKTINRLKGENTLLEQRLLQKKEPSSEIKSIMADKIDEIKQLQLKLEESEQTRLILEGEVKNIISIYQKLSYNKKILASQEKDFSIVNQELTQNKELQNNLINNMDIDNKDQLKGLIDKLEESEQKRFILEGEVRNIISIYEKLIENKSILADLQERNTSLKEKVSNKNE